MHNCELFDFPVDSSRISFLSFPLLYCSFFKIIFGRPRLLPFENGQCFIILVKEGAPLWPWPHYERTVTLTSEWVSTGWLCFFSAPLSVGTTAPLPKQSLLISITLNPGEETAHDKMGEENIDQGWDPPLPTRAATHTLVLFPWMNHGTILDVPF